MTVCPSLCARPPRASLSLFALSVADAIAPLGYVEPYNDFQIQQPIMQRLLGGRAPENVQKVVNPLQTEPLEVADRLWEVRDGHACNRVNERKDYLPRPFQRRVLDSR